MQATMDTTAKQQFEEQRAVMNQVLDEMDKNYGEYVVKLSTGYEKLEMMHNLQNKILEEKLAAADKGNAMLRKKMGSMSVLWDELRTRLNGLFDVREGQVQENAQGHLDGEVERRLGGTKRQYEGIMRDVEMKRRKL
jgi:hypothetical protein